MQRRSYLCNNKSVTCCLYNHNFFLYFTFTSTLFPHRGSGAAASAPWSVQINNTETAKHKKTNETEILLISVNVTAERIRVLSVLDMLWRISHTAKFILKQSLFKDIHLLTALLTNYLKRQLFSDRLWWKLKCHVCR